MLVWTANFDRINELKLYEKASVFDQITDLKRRWTPIKMYSIFDLPATTYNMVSKGK